jgi:hypothetical protein
MNWSQQLPDRTTGAGFKNLDAGPAFSADVIIAPLTDLVPLVAAFNCGRDSRRRRSAPFSELTQRVA